MQHMPMHSKDMPVHAMARAKPSLAMPAASKIFGAAVTDVKKEAAWDRSQHIGGGVYIQLCAANHPVPPAFPLSYTDHPLNTMTIHDYPLLRAAARTRGDVASDGLSEFHFDSPTSFYQQSVLRKTQCSRDFLADQTFILEPRGAGVICDLAVQKFCDVACWNLRHS